jgi:hypothetical protein
VEFFAFREKLRLGTIQRLRLTQCKILATHSDGPQLFRPGSIYRDAAPYFCRISRTRLSGIGSAFRPLPSTVVAMKSEL